MADEGRLLAVLGDEVGRGRRAGVACARGLHGGHGSDAQLWRLGLAANLQIEALSALCFHCCLRVAVP